MSTEARIGVVAGLFIVVVTSVYFFYGQSSQVDDLLVTSTGAKVSLPPKIPAGSESAKPGAPASSPPIAVANQQSPMAQPSSAVVSPVVRDSSLSTVDADRVASAEPASRSNAPLNTPPGAAKPAATDTGPTFGRARGTPPRIGGESPKPTGTTGDELAPTTWDHLSKSTEKPAEHVALGGKPETETQELPSLASGGPDRRDVSKQTRAAGANQPAPREAAGSLTADIRHASKATAVDAKSGAGSSAWPRQHKIVSGDTLIGLAFAYYEDTSRVGTILAANPQIRNPRGLKIGQVVTIPAPGVEQTPPARSAAATRNDSSGLVTLTGRTAPLRESGTSDSTVKPAAARTYTVQEGDTFYSIAARLYSDGNKWRTIYDANKSIVKNDPKRLRTGMNLTIPAASTQRP